MEVSHGKGKKKRASYKSITPEQKEKLKKFISDRKKALYNKSLKEKQDRGMIAIGGNNFTVKKKK